MHGNKATDLRFSTRPGSDEGRAVMSISKHNGLALHRQAPPRGQSLFSPLMIGVTESP